MAEHTSARAVLILQELGINNTSALLGGYNAWVSEGNPVVTGDKPR